MSDAALCAVPACRGDDEPRETARGHAMCSPCQHRLRRALEGLPGRYAALTPALAPTAATSAARTGGSSTDAQRAAIRPAVADLRADIRALLTSWAALVAERRETAATPAPTVASAARFLATHTDWLATHPAGPEAHAELIPVWRRARQLLDLPRDRARFVVGPCPETGCEGQVWAHIPTEGAEGSHMRCDDCEATWQTSQWLRAGARILAAKGEHPGPLERTA